MPRPKRHFLATAEETLTPPNDLAPGHVVARVVRAEGKNLYSVSLPGDQKLLVELPARFRSNIWIRRGGFVIVDTAAFHERENKLGGEIFNVVGDERVWRKMLYW